jgi:hypothetical protein
MARILINGLWYDELSSSALYESEYESIIIRHSETIYPDFIAVPFKKTVYSDEDSARADLALISVNYQSWWVVEVERSEHSLDGHVLPQIRTLSSATYDHSVCEYLCAKCPELDFIKVGEMLKGSQPKVLVIVNKPMPDWARALKRYDAELAVVEIFRSEHNQAVFRVNGYRPVISSDIISICRFEEMLPNFLEVVSPAVLPCGDKFTIMYDNGLSDWKRVDIADKVYLVPEKHNPLAINKKYELICCDSSRLEFRCVN